MPATTDEVSQIVKVCNNEQVPYNIRGNGSSVMGLVMCKDGLVMDMGRMKRIAIDKDNWCVSVGPGVAAFDLQKEVTKHGFRVNVAEPAALVCANIMCSGIFSTFSHAYGTAADNYINAEFVGSDGEVFDLNQRTAPNLFSFQPQEMPSPGVCTRVDMKLHPMTEDEDGVLVPFSSFHEATTFARDLSVRRIGLAVAVLGGEYMATFMSPVESLADSAKRVLKEDLGMEYAVLVIGDKYALDTVRKMSQVVVDSERLKILVLGFPKMVEDEWRDLVNGLEGDKVPYETLLKDEMRPLLETALRPAPEHIAEVVAPDLRSFYRELYSRPEMTNLVWLNMFRIISSRMGRRKHVVAFVVHVPLDKIDLIERINAEFERIGDGHSITHDYGFLTPLDMGKRAVLEYDYYVDHRDPADVERMQQAVIATGQMIEEFCQGNKGVRWIKHVFLQGFARTENILYT